MHLLTIRLVTCSSRLRARVRLPIVVVRRLARSEGKAARKRGSMLVFGCDGWHESLGGEVRVGGQRLRPLSVLRSSARAPPLSPAVTTCIFHRAVETAHTDMTVSQLQCLLACRQSWGSFERGPYRHEPGQPCILAVNRPPAATATPSHSPLRARGEAQQSRLSCPSGALSARVARYERRERRRGRVPSLRRRPQARPRRDQHSPSFDIQPSNHSSSSSGVASSKLTRHSTSCESHPRWGTSRTSARSASPHSAARITRATPHPLSIRSSSCKRFPSPTSTTLGSTRLRQKPSSTCSPQRSGLYPSSPRSRKGHQDSTTTPS